MNPAGIGAYCSLLAGDAGQADVIRQSMLMPMLRRTFKPLHQPRLGLAEARLRGVLFEIG